MALYTRYRPDWVDTTDHHNPQPGAMSIDAAFLDKIEDTFVDRSAQLIGIFDRSDAVTFATGAAPPAGLWPGSKVTLSYRTRYLSP